MKVPSLVKEFAVMSPLPRGDLGQPSVGVPLDTMQAQVLLRTEILLYTTKQLVSPMGWRGEGRNKSITSVVKDR